MTEFLTMKDAAEILKVQPYTIAYVLATKRVPEPLRIGGRRMFTHADLARISEILKLSPQIDDGKGADERA